MKDSYYFPHDYNAKGDQKILMLRARYDNIWGYGLFFMILESMAEEEDGYIDRVAIGGLSISYGLSIDKLTEFIDYCITIGLFLECKNGIYSRRMSDHKETRKSLSEAGKQGAKRRRDNRVAIATPLTTPMQRKGKERKGEESKIKDNNINIERQPTRSIFKKPTIDELKDYCKENNIFIDCDNFFDYYESNGWMVGKNKMKSWSATVKNRARRDKKSGTYKDPAYEDRDNYKKLLIENRLQETQGNHDETRQKKLRGVAQGMIAKYTEEKVREYRKQVLSSL